MSNTVQLTKKQLDVLKLIAELEKANGRPSPVGDYRTQAQALEAKGLVFSRLGSQPATKGGGWRVRRYGLTAAGREYLAALEVK